MRSKRIFPPALKRWVQNPALSLGLTGEAGLDFKSLADQARARRDFSADAFYRRRLCELDGSRAGHWTQYGHALKEAGFHARAEAAYLKAVAMRPEDADLRLHLAHLSKARGDMDAAAVYFGEAAALGHTRQEEISFELNLLKKVGNARVFRDANEPALKFRIYLSAPGGEMSESDHARTKAALGHGDYSYAFAMKGFSSALEALEIDHKIISHPEYIADIASRSNAEVNVHLGFYPPERLRLLKGAYNINCFAWEFDRLRLPTEVLTDHAFADQAAMLNLADEIWMPSHHGAIAVAPALDVPVHVVPAPVTEHLSVSARTGRRTSIQREKAIRAIAGVTWQPLAIVPRIQPHMNGGAKAREARLQSILENQLDGDSPAIFVTVFNVHDYRKQIAPMLKGFLEFSRRHRNAILLCKMTTIERELSVNDVLFGEQLSEMASLTTPMVSERIWITKDVLTRAEMNALYDVADHYVCSSHAEGQNLPLIEAMGRGVVPVSVSGTAMNGYISDDTAVVIASETKAFGRRLTRRYGLYGMETLFTSPDAVQDALERALNLTAEDYGMKSGAAFDRVREVFGLDAFGVAVQALKSRLQITGTDSVDE